MSMTGVQGDTMPYAFGDSELAARRLELLNGVFAGTSRAFLERTARPPSGLAVDLGCGPGYSTQLLAEALPCQRIVGIDNSEHFITLAQRQETERIRFALHDFTCIPFPVGPADVLYARFELSHMRGIAGLIEKWATQLRPSGILLLEETEWIHTSDPTFNSYLQVVEAMLANRGTKLYVGRALDALDSIPGLRRRSSDVGRICVTVPEAAAMFYLNIQTWKCHPFVQASYSSSQIENLEKDLEALTRRWSEASRIEWGLRQLVLERI